ncbi:uncharacterized protein LOC144102729 [Amblyomma americanum]
MASDGLCDIAFYDSIYADGRNILGDNRFGSDLVTFMGAVARYRKTKLGVAFAFRHIDQLGNDLRRTNPNPLQVFWQRRIYHTGVLDTPPNATRSQMMIAMSRIMILDRFAQSQRALNHGALTALSLHLQPGSGYTSLTTSSKFTSISLTCWRLQFIPDLLVVYGHYPFGDNTVDNCVVMPPTRLSAIPLAVELRGSFSYDMSHGPVGAGEWERRQLPTLPLVSVTMKGRWTRASQGQPLQFFSRCEKNPIAASFGSYTQVCRGTNYGPNLRYQTQHYAMLTYDAKNRTLFAYDNEAGLAAKLCKVKDTALDVTFGIAAYGVDYDDYVNDCGMRNKFGKHSRLKALRNVKDYYRSLASKIFNEARCTKVVS